MAAGEPQPPRPGALGSLRRHPVIVTVLVVGAVAGALAGVLFLPPEWSFARRLAAGVLSGAGIAFLMTATKMLAS